MDPENELKRNNSPPLLLTPETADSSPVQLKKHSLFRPMKLEDVSVDIPLPDVAKDRQAEKIQQKKKSANFRREQKKFLNYESFIYTGHALSFVNDEVNK